MTQPEFDPLQHELDVTKGLLKLARYALFDQTIDYYLDGHCSLEEAIEQYKHEEAA